MKLSKIKELGALKGLPTQAAYLSTTEESKAEIYNQGLVDCLSAEVDLSKLVDREKIEKVIDLYNGDNCPIDGSKVSWEEYKKHFAQALISTMSEWTKGEV